jgi:hypothetical protein
MTGTVEKERTVKPRKDGWMKERERESGREGGLV